MNRGRGAHPRFPLPLTDEEGRGLNIWKCRESFRGYCSPEQENLRTYPMPLCVNKYFGAMKYVIGRFSRISSPEWLFSDSLERPRVLGILWPLKMYLLACRLSGVLSAPYISGHPGGSLHLFRMYSCITCACFTQTEFFLIHGITFMLPVIHQYL